MSLYKTNKKIFNIDSSNKTNGTDSNFQIDIKMPHDNDFTHVSMVYGEFHKSWNMIDETNNTFQYKEDGDPAITLSLTPNRNYSSEELSVELELRLNENIPSNLGSKDYSVEYNDNTHRYSVANGTISFQFIFNANDPVLSKYLGIDSNVSSSLVPSLVLPFNVLLSNRDSNFSRYGCLVLRSSICTNYDNDELAYIYPSAYPDGVVIVYNPPDPYFSACTARTNTNSYSFSLTECHTGKTINMDNVPWRATLVCWKD